MFDNLGKRRYVLPLAAVVAIFCVMSLVVYPILNAAPKDVPFAALSLDEGADTPAGHVNAGEAILQNITGAAAVAGVESPIAWTVVESQAELDAALEDNEYYGALIVPAGFTQAQVAAQMAAAQGQTAPETPALSVIINQGKNPMVASTMQSALLNIFYQAGIKAEFTTIHSADVGGGAMAGLMSSNMMVMPFVMMTLVASILLFFTTRPAKGAARAEKTRAYGVQLAYAAVLSLLVAAADILIITLVGGLSVPAGTILLCLWAACFALMALFLGALDIAPPLGVLVVLLVFGCGMSAGMLAAEMMPAFWRDWVYPWVPQHYISQGINAIVYMGGGAWNKGSGPLAITGLLGLALMAVAWAIPSKRPAAVVAPA
jgi:hypothetical protein